MMATKKNWFLAQFDIFDQHLNGRKQQPAQTIRDQAREIFRQSDFPDTSHEAWRYTNLTPVMQYNFIPAVKSEPASDIRSFIQPYVSSPAHRLVFVNGLIQEEFSSAKNLPKKVAVKSLQEGFRTHADLIAGYLGQQSLASSAAVFPALNLSLLNDGAFIYLPDGVEIEEPLHLVFVSSCGGRQLIHQPVILLIAENDVRADVIVHTIGPSGEIYLTNILSETFIGRSSTVQFAHLQYDGSHAFHIYSMYARLAGQAQMIHHAMSLGAAISRNNIFVHLDGEEAESVLNGLFITDGQQHSDHATLIDHARPRCRSRENYKGILNGRSTGAFTGKILVRPDSQQTDAKQSSHNLLLSRDATMFTRPQLEIFADDVKCTHGATIGRINEQALFYLRTRGIDLFKAQAMLTTAFAQQLIDALPWPNLRDEVENKVTSLIRF